MTDRCESRGINTPEPLDHRKGGHSATSPIYALMPISCKAEVVKFLLPLGSDNRARIGITTICQIEAKKTH